MLLIPCCICVNRIKHWLCPCTCLSVCLSVCLSLKCLTHIVASFSGHSDSPGKVASIPHLGGGGRVAWGRGYSPPSCQLQATYISNLGFNVARERDRDVAILHLTVNLTHACIHVFSRLGGERNVLLIVHNMDQPAGYRLWLWGKYMSCINML